MKIKSVLNILVHSLFKYGPRILKVLRTGPAKIFFKACRTIQRAF